MRARIIDAFAEHPFSGNPAGVVLFGDSGFPDTVFLRQVAAELNLPMTAFAHPLGYDADADWALRWFMPLKEAALAPLWAARLARDELTAFQASERTGRLGLAVRGDRVLISGRAVTVLDGQLQIGG